MNQHDCCDCEIENCAVCALYPVCVGCKTNDDGGRLDGFDISVLNLRIVDCNGVLQEHGWVCGGCAFIENPNYLCSACGEAKNLNDPHHHDEEQGLRFCTECVE